MHMLLYFVHLYESIALCMKYLVIYYIKLRDSENKKILFLKGYK